MALMWKKMLKNVDIDEPHDFLTMYIWDALSVNANRMKLLLNRKRTENLLEWEKPHAQIVAWSYDMEGHAHKCVERYCELENKKKWSNCTKFQVFSWMIINSSRKNSNLLDNSQKFAHELS